MDDQKGAGLLGDYYRESDLARELNKHQRTLKRWRDSGIGPPYTLLGIDIIYPINRTKQWLAAGGTRSRRQTGKVA